MAGIDGKHRDRQGHQRHLCPPQIQRGKLRCPGKHQGTHQHNGAAAQPGLHGSQPKGQTKDGDEQRNRQQLPKTAPNGVAVERNGGGRQGRHGQSAFRKEQQKKRTGARVCPRFAPPATCAADALRARVFWPLGRRWECRYLQLERQFLHHGPPGFAVWWPFFAPIFAPIQGDTRP